MTKPKRKGRVCPECAGTGCDAAAFMEIMSQAFGVRTYPRPMRKDCPTCKGTGRVPEAKGARRGEKT